MASFWWVLLIVYFAISAQLTFWVVRADVPKIRAEYGHVNWFGVALGSVAIWVVAPILLVVHFYREARK